MEKKRPSPGHVARRAHHIAPNARLPKLAPRFKAGIASATVVVAPVSGSVSANPPKIDCNQNTQLAWDSKETVEADMSGMSPVPTSGEKTISPRQTTVYQLTASGPGGVATPSTTVEVNPVVQSSLSASPMEVKYRRIGDKIIEQGSTTLNLVVVQLRRGFAGSGWLGRCQRHEIHHPQPNAKRHWPSGRRVQIHSEVDQCMRWLGHQDGGGTPERLRRTHSEPCCCSSVFFPTDYPTKEDPTLGLVRSQQEVLTTLATGFKQYLEYDPDAKLSLGGYTDERGADEYNDSLSELRVQRVKDFLVSQGIAAEKIDTSAYGKQKPLDKATVSDLQTQNPNQPPEKWVRDSRATWLAYNRRVDIVLMPTNAESVRLYPNQAPDSQILWQIPKPARSAVEGYN